MGHAIRHGPRPTDEFAHRLRSRRRWVWQAEQLWSAKSGHVQHLNRDRTLHIAFAKVECGRSHPVIGRCGAKLDQIARGLGVEICFRCGVCGTSGYLLTEGSLLRSISRLYVWDPEGAKRQKRSTRYAFPRRLLPASSDWEFPPCGKGPAPSGRAQRTRQTG